MEDEHRGSKWAVVVFLGIVGLFGFALYIYFSERGKIIPSAGIVSIDSLSKELPPPQRLVVLNVGESNRFVWVGQESKWLFSSGPPCYVFDSSGRMIDWDWETGAGQSTSALAKAALEAPAISVEQAKEIILETYSAPPIQ